MLNHITTRINTLLLLLLALMAAAIIAMQAMRTAAGPLDPTGGPASSPGGIDGRIPIAVATSITAPGSYYFTKNITAAFGQDGIRIEASDVTLDLNGFTLTGGGGISTGIQVPSIQTSLVVRNGTVQLFAAGVDMVNANHSRVVDLSVFAYSGSYFGIRIGVRSGLDACIVGGGGGGGSGVILSTAATMRKCSISGNVGDGVHAGSQTLIEDNQFVENASGGASYAAIYAAGDRVTARQNRIGSVSNRYVLIDGVSGGAVVLDNVFESCGGISNPGARPLIAPSGNVEHANVC